MHGTWHEPQTRGWQAESFRPSRPLERLSGRQSSPCAHRAYAGQWRKIGINAKDPNINHYHSPRARRAVRRQLNDFYNPCPDARCTIRAQALRWRARWNRLAMLSYSSIFRLHRNCLQDARCWALCRGTKVPYSKPVQVRSSAVSTLALINCSSDTHS